MGSSVSTNAKHDAGAPTGLVWTPPSALSDLAERSDALVAAIEGALLDEDGSYLVYDDTDRVNASWAAAMVSMEHWSALRLLLCTDHAVSGTALLRLQFEALVRSAWLLYAATDAEVTLMQAELDTEAERRAGNLPFFGLMLKGLEGHGPPRLYQDLQEIKAVLGKSLNSFVHAGIHALNRGQHGFPERLACQVMQSANGVGTMTSMMLANLSGDPGRGAALNRLVPAFADCFPPLLPVGAPHARNV